MMMVDQRIALAHEIRQGRPFSSLQQAAVLGLMRTTDQVRRRLAAVVEPYGVTLQQYNVLRILRGSSPKPLPTLEIAARLIEQTPGITRLLDRLEAKGLVSRVRCAEDRRQILCSIAPAGLALLEQMDEPVDVIDREALSMLTLEQVEQLITLHDAIRAGNEDP